MRTELVEPGGLSRPAGPRFLVPFDISGALRQTQGQSVGIIAGAHCGPDDLIS
ncbi:MAG TPA: hypothetical protein VF241_12350 [Propionibacteriaceae bacterium]